MYLYIIDNPILVSMICQIQEFASLVCGLKIMDTKIGFPCLFNNVVKYFINLKSTTFSINMLTLVVEVTACRNILGAVWRRGPSSLCSRDLCWGEGGAVCRRGLGTACICREGVGAEGICLCSRGHHRGRVVEGGRGPSCMGLVWVPLVEFCK